MFCLPLLHLAFPLQPYFNELKAEGSSPEFPLASAHRSLLCAELHTQGAPAAVQAQPRGAQPWLIRALLSSPVPVVTPCACPAWQGGSSPVPLVPWLTQSLGGRWAPGTEGWRRLVPRRNWDGHNLCCPRGACSALSSWMQILHGSKTMKNCGMKYPGKNSASYLHLPPLAENYFPLVRTLKFHFLSKISATLLNS